MNASAAMASTLNGERNGTDTPTPRARFSPIYVVGLFCSEIGMGYNASIPERNDPRHHASPP